MRVCTKQCTARAQNKIVNGWFLIGFSFCEPIFILMKSLSVQKRNHFLILFIHIQKKSFISMCYGLILMVPIYILFLVFYIIMKSVVKIRSTTIYLSGKSKKFRIEFALFADSRNKLIQ